MKEVDKLYYKDCTLTVFQCENKNEYVIRVIDSNNIIHLYPTRSCSFLTDINTLGVLTDMAKQLGVPDYENISVMRQLEELTYSPPTPEKLREKYRTLMRVACRLLWVSYDVHTYLTKEVKLPCFHYIGNNLYCNTSGYNTTIIEVKFPDEQVGDVCDIETLI